MSTAMTVITGSVEQKMKAFAQISAAASAGLFPPGYDTGPRAIAACWKADAVGVHPITFMEGNHVFEIDGKRMNEPKWEFINGLLRARLAGFDYEVLNETEDECTIKMWAEGRRPQIVTYSMEDARRQGFANKPTYKTSSREMLFKQCFKRAADRVGYDALMGLGSSVPIDYEVGEDAKPTGSVAEVLEDAAGEVVQEEVTIKMLAEKINELWGNGKNVAGKKKLEICGMVMKEMKTPREFKKIEELGPFEVKSIFDYLVEKYPDGKLEGPATQTESVAEVVEEVEVPQMEAEDDPDDQVPEPEGEDEEVEVEANDAPLLKAETLLYLCSSARKQAKRKFIIPTRPGVFFFVDEPILKNTGFSESQCIQKDGVQVIGPEDCKTLCMALLQIPGVALPGAEPLARHGNRT